MAYLTEEQINESVDESLIDSRADIIRQESRSIFNLISPHKYGLKGVVWQARDDLGNPVALKIIPFEEYVGHSLLDEMTEASKLDPRYFASVTFFGDLEIKEMIPSGKYKAIATEWIDGMPFNEFANTHPLTGTEYFSLAEQLFTALAVLRRNNLCHDDLHPGNILIQKRIEPLTSESVLAIRVIDTGTIKRLSTRERLLKELRTKVHNLREANAPSDQTERLKKFLEWKEPDDHLRVVESLLYAANSLGKSYYRLDSWERRFFDQLKYFFQQVTDSDLNRRLDSPGQVVSELRALVQTSKAEETNFEKSLASPFDYISAEMIRNDREFAELFSQECPWLENCESLEPLYIYGPRGCGKSSVLRWLSFKTIEADAHRNDFDNLREIGVYVSCSVELRSRFWLLDEETIDKLQPQIIRFFNLILLEELFDTLLRMWRLEVNNIYYFDLQSADLGGFTKWIIGRLNVGRQQVQFRLQGQSHLDYLRSFIRKYRWDTWASIQKAKIEQGIADPSLVADICRVLPEYFSYFANRHVTFLVDDYSNQRIPAYLQRKLNQTISFAKQGTPIFKVSSEYRGVDLEGIQEGREVVEINVGEKYTSLLDGHKGSKFLIDIANIRLKKARYKSNIQTILGHSSYNELTMPMAILQDDNLHPDKEKSRPFYYNGIECIHYLCSGDVALALDLIKRIFDENSVITSTVKRIPEHAQHDTIQQFSHDEIRRIKSVVPYGEDMHEIACYLGCIARAFVINKRSNRKEKRKHGEPVCKTHLDIRVPALQELNKIDEELAKIYAQLTSRAILFSLETSRSRISGATERLQMRRIYLPSFKAPLKRDVPIKLDSVDDLISLLSNPKAFAERELKKSNIDPGQLDLALQVAKVKPRE